MMWLGAANSGSQLRVNHLAAEALPLSSRSTRRWCGHREAYSRCSGSQCEPHYATLPNIQSQPVLLAHLLSWQGMNQQDWL